MHVAVTMAAMMLPVPRHAAGLRACRVCAAASDAWVAQLRCRLPAAVGRLRGRCRRGAVAAAGRGLVQSDDRQRLGPVECIAADDRGRLPVLAAEAALPGALPHSDGVPARRAGARRHPRRLRHGPAARPLLPRLLLGADGASVRRRRHEPGVGRGAVDRGGAREAGAGRPLHLDRPGAGAAGRRRAGSCSRRHCECDACAAQRSRATTLDGAHHAGFIVARG